MIKPYESGPDPKKRQIRRMFNRIAWRYDALNRWLSLGIDRHWRRRAISALDPQKTSCLLDVATGTADLALAAARRLERCRVIGLDVAEAMLELGRKKVERAGWEGRVSLLAGDAENMPFPDNTFDAVTVAFGVRNFQHPEAGLREMRRVLKPGGQLVVLEFSRPAAPVLRPIYQGYFRHVLPLLGGWFSKDREAYAYLFRSVQAFPEGKDFEALLLQSGYNDTTCTPLTFGICSLYTAFK